MSMTSKERVRTVLEGGIPDRVPLGEFAVDADTVERVLGHETYLRAKAKCTIAFWEGRHDEVAQSWIEDTIALHRALPLDILTFPMASWRIPDPSDEPAPRQVDHETWEDLHGRIFKYSPITADITCVHDPVAAAWEPTVEDFTWRGTPPPMNETSRRVRDTILDALGATSFVAGPDGGEVGQVMLGGMEAGMMRLIEMPEVVSAAAEQRLAMANAADADAMHPCTDAVLWGDDFGYKNGTMISPTMFREFFLEPNRQRVAHVHDHGRFVLKHCCGNISSLLDTFVDIGYDCYQSIQSTAGMDLATIKASHGDRMTLWGGVALETLLEGTVEATRQAVQQAIAAGKPGGRFILGSSHSWAVGCRYDNCMAMIDEWDRLAAY